MTRLALLPLFALLFAPLAQALTLEEALLLAPSRPEAVTARLELLNAETELLRLRSDPLALRLGRVQAEQAVLLGRAELKRAFYEALAEVARAYTGALEAAAGLELAREARSLVGTSLDIARIRLANGSATPLDVQEAEVALEDAGTSEGAAASALSVAEANLSGILGLEVTASDLEGVPDAFLVPLPPLEGALETAREHPQPLQVEQGLELARLGLELLDPSYASLSQLEAARTQLRSSEELAEEAERGFRVQVQNLHLGAETAALRHRVAEEALGNAQERLETQQARLGAGLISGVEAQQAELAALEARFRALEARHAYLNALLQFQEGALAQLSGPEALNYALVRFAAEDGAGDED